MFKQAFPKPHFDLESKGDESTLRRREEALITRQTNKGLSPNCSGGKYDQENRAYSSTVSSALKENQSRFSNKTPRRNNFSAALPLHQSNQASLDPQNSKNQSSSFIAAYNQGGFLRKSDSSQFSKRKEAPLIPETPAFDFINKIPNHILAVGQTTHFEINEKDPNELRKKVHELRESLRIETISSEELRAYIELLKEVIETKFEESKFLELLKGLRKSQGFSIHDVIVELHRLGNQIEDSNKESSMAQIKMNELEELGNKLRMENLKLMRVVKELEGANGALESELQIAKESIERLKMVRNENETIKGAQEELKKQLKALGESSEDKEAIILSLQQENKSNLKEVDFLKEKNEALALKAAGLKKQLAEVENRLLSNQTAREKEFREKEQFVQSNEFLKEQLKSIKEAFEKTQESNRLKEEEINGLGLQMKSLKVKITEEELLKENLRREIQALKSSERESAEKTRIIEENYKSLKNSFESLQEKHSSLAQQVIENNGVRMKLERTEKEMEVLGSENYNAIETNKELLSQIEHEKKLKEIETQEIAKVIDSLKKELRSSRNEAKSLKEGKEILEKEIQSKSHAIRELQGELAKEQRIYEDQIQKEEGLCGDLDILKKTAKKLEGAIEQEKLGNKKLREELQIARESSERLESTVERSKCFLERILAGIAESNSRTLELNKESIKEGGDLRQFSSRRTANGSPSKSRRNSESFVVASNKRKMANQNEPILVLIEKIESIECEVRTGVEQVAKKHVLICGELEASRKTMKELEAQVSQSSQKIQCLSQKEAELKGKLHEAETKLAKKESESMLLGQKLHKAEMSLIELEKELGIGQQNIKSKETLIDSLEKQLSQLQVDVSCQKYIISMTKRLPVTNPNALLCFNELSRLKPLLASLEQQKKEMELSPLTSGSLSRLKDEVNEIKAKMDQLEKEMRREQPPLSDLNGTQRPLSSLRYSSEEAYSSTPLDRFHTGKMTTDPNVNDFEAIDPRQTRPDTRMSTMEERLSTLMGKVRAIEENSEENQKEPRFSTEERESVFLERKSPSKRRRTPSKPRYERASGNKRRERLSGVWSTMEGEKGKEGPNRGESQYFKLKSQMDSSQLEEIDSVHLSPGPEEETTSFQERLSQPVSQRRSSQVGCPAYGKRGRSRSRFMEIKEELFGENNKIQS